MGGACWGSKADGLVRPRVELLHHFLVIHTVHFCVSSQDTFNTSVFPQGVEKRTRKQNDGETETDADAVEDAGQGCILAREGLGSAKDEFELLWAEAEGCPITAEDIKTGPVQQTYLNGDVTPYELYIKMFMFILFPTLTKFFS